MRLRHAALTVVVLFGGCASAPPVRQEAEFPVSELRWNFERDALPAGQRAGSLLNGALGGLLGGRAGVIGGAIGGAATAGELGSLQEGIPMTLLDLSRTIAEALAQSRVEALADGERHSAGRADPRSPTHTLLGRSSTLSSAQEGASSSLASSAAGATGAGGGAVDAPRSTMPLALATLDRYVTDWREIPGREAGVLWWRKPWLTEIRHEVRALPSLRDPAKLSNVAIDSELRERPNTDYPWQPAEVATPAARAAHQEIRRRVLATVRATIDLKRSPSR